MNPVAGKGNGAEDHRGLFDCRFHQRGIRSCKKDTGYPSLERICTIHRRRISPPTAKNVLMAVPALFLSVIYIYERAGKA